MDHFDIRYQPTWDDDIAGYDFVALHGNTRVGRILTWPAGSWEIRWQWTARFPGRPSQGHQPSMREAMIELEARYAAYLEKQS